MGFAVGAIVGSRLAPHLLASGASSPWLPVATMVIALVLGLSLQALAGTAAGQIRHHLLRGPLETVDTAGGLAVGAVFGVALVWLAAVIAVQQPLLGLRSDVERSEILPALLRAMPASTVLDAIARFDPLPVIPSLADRALPEPTPGAVSGEAAKPSVVKIQGEACGLVIQGSGWVVAPGLIATNAPRGGRRARPDGQLGWREGPAIGRVVAVSAANDVALIRVPGLNLPVLRMAAQDPSGQNVAMVGYPTT